MSKGPHSIPLSDAAALTLRWRQSRPAGGFNGARFDRIAFDNILAQPGCAGVRIYMGLHDPKDPKHQGDPSMWTYVLVGTDAKGNDMTTIPGGASAADAGGDSGGTDGDTEQEPIPCPPTCGDPSPLNTPP